VTAQGLGASEQTNLEAGRGHGRTEGGPAVCPRGASGVAERVSGEDADVPAQKGSTRYSTGSRPTCRARKLDTLQWGRGTVTQWNSDTVTQ